MNKKLTVLFCFLFSMSATVFGQEKMTVDRFKELVSAPGDHAPLSVQILAMGTIWTNVECSVTFKYQNGKIFKDVLTRNAKTISGKYVIFTFESTFYKRSFDSILAYDEAASAYKNWALDGDTLLESTTIYFPEKKIFASTSAYGDGFTDIGVGTVSDTGSVEHVAVYQKGVLSFTRDAIMRPVKNSN